MGGVGSGRRRNPNKPVVVRRKRVPAADIERAVREAHAAGKRVSAVLETVPIAYGTAAAYARKIGLRFKKGRKAGPDQGRNDKRIPLIEALYRDGYTLREIGDQYGITRERVRQILTKHRGIVGKDGGAAIAGQRAEEKRRAKRDAIALKKHGCSHAQYLWLRRESQRQNKNGVSWARTPTGAFGGQRANAHRRGIGWELNLWQWWTIWQESGHWEERGRGQGYVMCRVKDEGPYAVGNVFIATAIENCSDAPKKRKHDLPCGVHKIEIGNYLAYGAIRQVHGKRLYLGAFKTPALAHAAYLAAAPTSRSAA